mgnify:CR=1 FL=1
MRVVLFFFLIFNLSSLFSEDSVPNYPLTRKENGNVFAMHKELNSLNSDSIFVLNFTKTTCKPCKKEIPELISLLKTNPKMKLALVFMGDSDKEVDATIKALGVPPEVLVLMDRLEVSFSKLGFQGVPNTFITGKNKNVQARLEGYTEENMKTLKDILKN